MSMMFGSSSWAAPRADLILLDLTMFELHAEQEVENIEFTARHFGHSIHFFSSFGSSSRSRSRSSSSCSSSFSSRALEIPSDDDGNEEEAGVAWISSVEILE